jgi:poly(3-hydroxybutyrate) depolymerase
MKDRAVPLFMNALAATLTTVLLWSTAAAAATNVEKTFQDPKSGKSGKYTISLPDASIKPQSMGLLIFFHGSGGTQSYASAFESLSGVAKENNLIALALQAPNGNDTWANHATGPGNQHETYVKSLLDSAIFPTVAAIDRNKIVFVGLSAGSTFLSGDFLPKYISDFKGGAVLLCGGGGPVSLQKDFFTGLTKSNSLGFRLAYYIQKKDFLFTQTMQGINYWRGRNATVSFETPEGGSHCGFDVNKEMSKLIKKVLSR